MLRIGVFSHHANQDKTKEMYKKLLLLDLHTDEGNTLLKQTIHEGQGPYVGLAVKLMCEHIVRQNDCFGSYSTENKIYGTQEKYLSVAREKCPALGFYFTTEYLVKDCERLSGHQFTPSHYREALKNYFLLEASQHSDPEGYRFLEKITLKQLSEKRKKLQEKIAVLLDRVDGYKKDEIEALRNELDILSSIQSPMDILKRMMNKQDISYTGNMAKDLRQQLTLEEKPAPSFRSSN